MDSTIPAAVRTAASQFADAVAVVEPGGPTLTYRQLHAGVREVAKALIASGIEPGDRIAIWSPNTHHWVLGALGTLYAGATLVPVNTRFTGPEALDVITRSQARALLVADRFLGTDRLALLVVAADAAAAGLPELIVRIPLGELAGTSGSGGHPPAPAGTVAWDELVGRAAAVSEAVADERARSVGPEHVSDILFTSGTTGRSKGARSAHRQALDVARAWADCAELSAADRYLIVNPFFHSFGYKAGILACLLTGAAMVPQRIFDVGAAMALIESERITVVPGAPTIYTSILDHPERARYDLSSLRLAVTGAAVVPVALVERMRAELSLHTVLTAYGLTEAVVVTMCRPGDDPRTVATTSGRATAGFEIKIAKAASEADAAGEILLRGPNVMLGYLDDQAATAEAIDSGGWLHTGDVGCLDDRGYLTITDRLKDMYICGGFNVYPAEVEQALARHPGVAESVVIGVPDGRLGEVGKAFVVTRPGAEPAADELIEFCRARLANYKVPRQVEFRADLPRNPAGKPLKRLLRQESR
ncbi:MAG TPA: FadD3 family acyl-CoA ligase [Streptosporangiaceae bacterium]|nr:FadD3 family acyl-CoA ligase [Streptosporangiaceae bacterium]